MITPINFAFLNFLLCRTDVDALLDDIVAKEPLITPSKMEQVRKLIISILKERIVQLL